VSQNLDLVRSIYAALERGDSNLNEWIAPDIAFDYTAVYPDQAVLRGISAARRFQGEAWGASQRFVAERYFDVDGERVLVFARVKATGQSSGAEVQAQLAHEFTISDGVVVHVKVYPDRAEALEALGLEE
jgi:ketosteroid isomerase-like protein